MSAACILIGAVFEHRFQFGIRSDSDHAYVEGSRASWVGGRGGFRTSRSGPNRKCTVDRGYSIRASVLSDA